MDSLGWWQNLSLDVKVGEDNTAGVWYSSVYQALFWNLPVRLKIHACLSWNLAIFVKWLSNLKVLKCNLQVLNITLLSFSSLSSTSSEKSLHQHKPWDCYLANHKILSIGPFLDVWNVCLKFSHATQNMTWRIIRKEPNYMLISWQGIEKSRGSSMQNLPFVTKANFSQRL